MMIAKIQCSFSFFLLLYNRVGLRTHYSATQCSAEQCNDVVCYVMFYHVKLHFSHEWVGGWVVRFSLNW